MLKLKLISFIIFIVILFTTVSTAGAYIQNPKLNNEKADLYENYEQYVSVGFSRISISGQGPVGLELIKTQDKNISFDFVGMDNEENCSANASLVNGVMEITVDNYAPNGLQVDFEGGKNIVRVYIPNAVYSEFSIKSKKMVVKMQDFNASVNVEADSAGFWLIDKNISYGNYDINVSDGPLYIEADYILNDISAVVNNGPLTIQFNENPVNIYIDSQKCGPVVNRPDGWGEIYRAGNETPRIILDAYGKTTLNVKQ